MRLTINTELHSWPYVFVNTHTRTNTFVFSNAMLSDIALIIKYSDTLVPRAHNLPRKCRQKGLTI